MRPCGLLQALRFWRRRRMRARLANAEAVTTATDAGSGTAVTETESRKMPPNGVEWAVESKSRVVLVPVGTNVRVAKIQSRWPCVEVPWEIASGDTRLSPDPVSKIRTFAVAGPVGPVKAVGPVSAQLLA